MDSKEETILDLDIYNLNCFPGDVKFDDKYDIIYLTLEFQRGIIP
jgi:hypothetical protein